MSVPTDPPPPEGVVFPVGLFDYRVDVADPGDPADVTFHLPDGVLDPDVNAEFWVLQDGQWTDLTPNAEVDAVADSRDRRARGRRRSATRTAVADGVIDDPSGPAIERPPATARSRPGCGVTAWATAAISHSPVSRMGLWTGDGDGVFEPGGDDRLDHELRDGR